MSTQKVWTRVVCWATSHKKQQVWLRKSRKRRKTTRKKLSQYISISSFFSRLLLNCINHFFPLAPTYGIFLSESKFEITILYCGLVSHRRLKFVSVQICFLSSSFCFFFFPLRRREFSSKTLIQIIYEWYKSLKKFVRPPSPNLFLDII